MNIIDICIGIAAGYYVHTPNGRKEAKAGLDTVMSLGGKVFNKYVKPSIFPQEVSTSKESEKQTEENKNEEEEVSI